MSLHTICHNVIWLHRSIQCPTSDRTPRSPTLVIFIKARVQGAGQKTKDCEGVKTFQSHRYRALIINSFAGEKAELH